MWLNINLEKKTQAIKSKIQNWLAEKNTYLILFFWNIHENMGKNLR